MGKSSNSRDRRIGLRNDAVGTIPAASNGAVLGTFAVGTSPLSLIFDGADIWVANSDGTVTKLRASNGANLGTFTVGGAPQAIAFDGAYVWVTNTSGGVSKL